jgi:hypothetical protein
VKSEKGGGPGIAHVPGEHLVRRLAQIRHHQPIEDAAEAPVRAERQQPATHF